MKLLLIGLIAMFSTGAFSKTICTTICLGAYDNQVDGNDIRTFIASGSSRGEAIQKLIADCQALQGNDTYAPAMLVKTSTKYDYITSTISQNDKDISCTDI